MIAWFRCNSGPKGRVPTKKVLILSCNTGQGHNAAGLAVREELQRRGIPCEMKDCLSFGKKNTSHLASGLYVNTVVAAPKVFGVVYRMGKAISSSKRKSPVYLANSLYADKLLAYIQEGGFDCVVMPHIYPAEALTWLKKHRGLDIPTWFIATDYTCIPFTEETVEDGYFISSPLLAEEFAGRGIPAEKLIPTGIPVSRRFSEPAGKAEARATLSMPAEAPSVLVMTGSMGCGHLTGMLRCLLNGLPAEGRIRVLCGRNEKLRAGLLAEFGGDFRLEALPFTKEVPLYMAASDVLITKPGGLTTTEAAALGIPLVLAPAIPGCETRNTVFFREHGMALAAASHEEAGELALRLLNDPAARETMVAAQKRFINTKAASDICDRLEGVTP